MKKDEISSLFVSEPRKVALWRRTPQAQNRFFARGDSKSCFFKNNHEILRISRIIMKLKNLNEFFISLEDLQLYRIKYRFVFYGSR